MDPNDYINNDQTSDLEDLCISYHGLEAELYEVKERGRQLTQDEHEELETPGWDIDTYGFNTFFQLKEDISAVSTDGEAKGLISECEAAVRSHIAEIEREIESYPAPPE